nr:cytochrome P450 CYP736A12-like [Ipomoea trifida]
MNTAWIWTAFAVIAAISVLKALFLKKKGKRLPPGPRGLPILGHFHLVGKNPHQDLHKLAKTYGPIMHLRFGLVHNIVASTPEAAKQFLKTHDLNFATRPPSEAAKYISNGQKGSLSFQDQFPSLEIEIFVPERSSQSSTTKCRGQDFELLPSVSGISCPRI